MARHKADPIDRLLDLYRELTTDQRAEFSRCAKRIHSDEETPKPVRVRKAKEGPQAA